MPDDTTRAGESPWGEIRIPRDLARRTALYDEAGLTANERAAMEEWAASQEPLTSIDDLLTAAEQVALRTDLAEIARLRRRSGAEAATWPMP